MWNLILGKINFTSLSHWQLWLYLYSKTPSPFWWLMPWKINVLGWIWFLKIPTAIHYLRWIKNDFFSFSHTKSGLEWLGFLSVGLLWEFGKNLSLARNLCVARLWDIGALGCSVCFWIKGYNSLLCVDWNLGQHLDVINQMDNNTQMWIGYCNYIELYIKIFHLGMA